MLEAVGTTSARGKNTRSVLHKRINQLKKIKLPTSRKWSIFWTLSATAFCIAGCVRYFLTDSSGQRNVSISVFRETFNIIQAYYVSQAALTTRMGLYDTHFSSVQRQYPLEISTPCTFRHLCISLWTFHTLWIKIIRCLSPTFAAACGALRSNEQVHISFESLKCSCSGCQKQ